MSYTTYDAFLSYSKKDSSFARALSKELTDQGLRVWFGGEQIATGDSFLRAIEEALENSRYFILVISPDYLSGQWSNFEMGVALGQGVEILPVFVRTVEKKALPPWISETQGFSAENLSIEKIATSLADIIKHNKRNKKILEPTPTAQH